MTSGKVSKGSSSGSGFTLETLAGLLGASLEGDPELFVSGVAGLANASETDVSLVAASRNLKDLSGAKAGAVIAPTGLELPFRNVLRVSNPYLAFAKSLELFHPFVPPEPGVHQTAVVEDGAKIDTEACVSAFCFVGEGASVAAGAILSPFCHLGKGSKVGKGTLLHPRVTILDGIEIGADVIIHSGTVVGSDGFGYVFDGDGHYKIPQVGGVAIGDDVEIGANVAIDRSTTGMTRIGRGVKIDNLVQIAHNVEIDEHAVIVAQVGLSGSTRIGKGAILGGQSGTVGHLTIGDNARVAAQAGVMNDVPAGETVSGIGPLPHRQWLRAQGAYNKLPEMLKRLRALEKKIGQLEEKSR